jgi:hypothetical protein
VLLAGAAAYFGGREAVEGSTHQALRNARRIIGVEEAMGIHVERPVQQFVLRHELLRVVGNLSYTWLYWLLLVFALVALYRCDHAGYRRLRNAMFCSGGVGLVLFTVFPVAPPRFMPGFVGTVSDSSRRLLIPYPMEWANRFAAFPSFHAGWALIACMALASAAGRGWRRAAATAPGVLVIASVVTTANHYLLDVLAGTAIALGSYRVLAPRHADRAAEDRDGRRPLQAVEVFVRSSRNARSKYADR